MCFKYIPAPREKKEAGTLLSTARGEASPWFTSEGSQPADGDMSLTQLVSSTSLGRVLKQGVLGIVFS